MKTLIFFIVFFITINIYASEFSSEDEAIGRNEVLTQCIICHKVTNRISMPFYNSQWSSVVPQKKDSHRKELIIRHFEDNAKLLIDLHRNTQSKAYFESQRFKNNKHLIEHTFHTTRDRYYENKGRKAYHKKCKKCHGGLISYTSKHYSYEFKKYFDNDADLLKKIHKDTNATAFFKSNQFKTLNVYIKYAYMMSAYDTYEGCRGAGMGWPKPYNKNEDSN